jgi:hypothetical protein
MLDALGVVPPWRAFDASAMPEDVSFDLERLRIRAPRIYC